MSDSAAQCWQSAFCRAFDHKPGCPYYAIGRGIDEHMHPDPQGRPREEGKQ